MADFRVISEMERFLELYAEKISLIQTNLLDLLSSLVRHQNKRSADGRPAPTGPAVKREYSDNVMIGKSYFQKIEAFVAKTGKNVAQLNQLVDKTLAEREQVAQKLNQCLKREAQYRKQLEEMRRLYQIVKDKLEQKEIVEEMFGSSVTTNGQRYSQLNDYFKNSLALILNSMTNTRNVQSITENQEVFNAYMSALLNVVQKYIADHFEEELDAEPNPYEPELIETICSICVNIFLYSEFLCQDINVWIQSLCTLVLIDKRYLKIVIMALHNLCFNCDGHEEMAKQKGVVALMAKVLIDPEYKYDFKLKTSAVKAITRMLQMTRGKGIDLLLYNEFIEKVPIDHMQQMASRESHVQLKKVLMVLNGCLSQLEKDNLIED